MHAKNKKQKFTEQKKHLIVHHDSDTVWVWEQTCCTMQSAAIKKTPKKCRFRVLIIYTFRLYALRHFFSISRIFPFFFGCLVLIRVPFFLVLFKTILVALGLELHVFAYRLHTIFRLSTNRIMKMQWLSGVCAVLLKIHKLQHRYHTHTHAHTHSSFTFILFAGN